MKTENDVIIIGSGPAGISTWLHLQLLNPDIAARTIIIEKEKHPREKLCGGAILNYMVNKIFKNLNITMNIPKVDINQINIIFGQKQFLFNKDTVMSIINREIFDEALVNYAKKRGAIIHENEEYLELLEENENLVINTTKNTYSTRFVVGADGALSKIRKKIIQEESISYASTLETFARVNPSVDKEFDSKSMVMDFSCFHQGIQGYIWHFPVIKHHQSYMNHGICNSKIISQKASENIKERFIKELQKRDINPQDVTIKSHPVTYFKNSGILSNKQVILAGDAAGIEPLIGGGIHLSLLYGHIAAKTIIDCYDLKDVRNYTTNIANSYVGKYISNSIEMAKKIYSGKSDLLETIKFILRNI